MMARSVKLDVAPLANSSRLNKDFWQLVMFYFRLHEPPCFLPRESEDFGEYQNHPDDQNEIEDHPNMKKYIEEPAVGVFIVLVLLSHDSVHHQSG